VLSLAYIAGLFDGEGSIRITTSGGFYSHHPSSLDVRIGQNAYANAVLQLICDRFGGTLHVYENGYSQWIVTAKSAAKFLVAIEPRLYIKREEARLAINYQYYLNGQHQIRGVRLTEIQLAERYSFYEALMSERYNDSWTN
jgi:hypothetical protein